MMKPHNDIVWKSCQIENFVIQLRRNYLRVSGVTSEDGIDPSDDFMFLWIDIDEPSIGQEGWENVFLYKNGEKTESFSEYDTFDLVFNPLWSNKVKVMLYTKLFEILAQQIK